MKRLVLSVLCFLAVSPAFATGKEPTPPADPTPQVVVTTGVDQEQTQQQAQQQTTQVTAGAASTATLTGNTQQVNIKDQKQAPSVFTAATDTTAECARSVGGGFSVAGFGISGTTAIRDRDCRLLKAAAYEQSLGNTLAAVHLRCATSLYRGIFAPGDCVAYLEQQPVAAPVEVQALPEPSYAREEIREALTEGSK